MPACDIPSCVIVDYAEIRTMRIPVLHSTRHAQDQDCVDPHMRLSKDCLSIVCVISGLPGYPRLPINRLRYTELTWIPACEKLDCVTSACDIPSLRRYPPALYQDY